MTRATWVGLVVLVVSGCERSERTRPAAAPALRPASPMATADMMPVGMPTDCSARAIWGSCRPVPLIQQEHDAAKLHPEMTGTIEVLATGTVYIDGFGYGLIPPWQGSGAQPIAPGRHIVDIMRGHSVYRREVHARVGQRSVAEVLPEAGPTVFPSSRPDAASASCPGEALWGRCSVGPQSMPEIYLGVTSGELGTLELIVPPNSGPGSGGDSLDVDGDRFRPDRGMLLVPGKHTLRLHQQHGSSWREWRHTFVIERGRVTRVELGADLPWITSALPGIVG